MPAPMALADSPAGQDHPIARSIFRVATLDHLPGEVDTRNMGKAAYQGRLVTDDQAVLVVQGRGLHGDRDVALGQPIVIDSEERVVALGTAASDRAASMASLEAPDFELPDLAGRMHTLSEHRGKKALLIAYASW